MKLTEITKPSRTIYMVKKADTDEYVTSGRRAYFGSFEEAAIFHQEKNALAVIRNFKNRKSNNEERDQELNSLKLETVTFVLKPKN
jgi:hypothetical protein